MTDENHEEQRPKPLWERWGVDRQHWESAVCATSGNQSKLDDGIEYIYQARDFLSCLEHDEDLSGKSFRLYLVVDKALRKATKKLAKYAKQQFKRDILGQTPIRNLKNGNDREAEQRELIKRLSALSYGESSDVMALFVHMELLNSKEDADKKNELLEMMKTEPLSYVIAYARLSEKGIVQLTNGGGGLESSIQ